jgi:hypothetical protein
MIEEILPSDVEFARELLRGSRSEAEILAALASRGINSAQASQMLEDLRQGREPNSRSDLALGSKVRREEPDLEMASAHPSHRSVSRHRHSRYHHHRQTGALWWFALLAIVFLWALCYIWLKLGSDPTRGEGDFDSDRAPDTATKDVRW